MSSCGIHAWCSHSLDAQASSHHPDSFTLKHPYETDTAQAPCERYDMLSCRRAVVQEPYIPCTDIIPLERRSLVL
ncbi:hypothetical protein M514_22577 [Trichuris suis]|uniref:Uncharacterized protein n=1 Tax=Trichuris suis TaxID=68888 RepID=A0A085N6V1_9BILA|nr:hypothetical protein M514_22577 [Trichuris suis]